MNKRIDFSAAEKAITLVACLALLSGCTPNDKKNASPAESVATPVILPDPPQEIIDSIRKEFPNAAPVHFYADSVLTYISVKYGITPAQILVGASTCVDDIIYTKNFQSHREIKGPFHLGGLAGLPFTGISGLNAFAHHIPENGSMVLEIAPHIGYSRDKGWGYVLRPGQHESSSCCGALMGTLQSLESGSLSYTQPSEEDYQGIIIDNMALQHQKEISGHHNPLVVLTKVTFKEAEKRIREQLKSVAVEHVKYVVVMTGVLINTDYEYTDYLWLNHFAVYDVKNKKLLEDKSIEPE